MERLWLTDPRSRTANRLERFGRDPFKPELAATIDAAGLPHIGRVYTKDEPYASTFDPVMAKYNVRALPNIAQLTWLHLAD